MSSDHDPATAGPPDAPRDPAARRADRRARRRAARAARPGPLRHLPTWRVTLGTLLLGLLVLGGALAAGYLLVDIPAANATATAQDNVYLYADGSELASSGTVNRENIPLGRVPRTAQRAVLAAEDRDFYHESAIDPRAMLRGAWNTATGKGRQSGSTITQQYVKNYYLNQEQTVSRKVEEFFIAVKLDREQTKADILQGYLNTSYFGRDAYGIQAAARAYYHEDASRLDTAQGAYLASLLNAPSYYDVRANPPARPHAIARWRYVLDGMVKEHWLTPAARARLRFPEPYPISTPTALSGQRGYLVGAVTDYLIDHHVLDRASLAAGGYRITTTIERPRQDALTSAVNGRLLDRVSASGPAADQYLRAGGASIDPATGHVVALYGGSDFTRQYVDDATRRDYQVGSTFKPFVFAAALQHHATTQDGRPITPNTVYDGTDHRPVRARSGPTGYAPGNEDGRSYGSITVAEATNRSVNAVYAQLAEDVGPARVRQTAIALGLPATTPGLAPYPSIALGVATASPLDMAQGYATLDAHGAYLPYTLVTDVRQGGQALALPHPAPRQAVSRQAADTTTALLRDVVRSADGTGTAAQAAHRPAAGKTGTAEDDKAAWFAGYTPDLVTVVAVLGQDPATGAQRPLYGATGLGRVNGGDYPARIWADYTAAALRGRPARDFQLHPLPGTGTRPPAAPSATDAAPTGPPTTGAGPYPPPGPPTAPAPSTDPTGADEPGAPDAPDPGYGTGGGDPGGPFGGGPDDGGGDGKAGGGAGTGVHDGGPPQGLTGPPPGQPAGQDTPPAAAGGPTAPRPA